MILMVMHCGTSLVPLWSHNFCMPALLGGDILKPTKGTDLLQSIVSTAITYGNLPRSFSTLDELREDADEQLYFSSRYNPNHVLTAFFPNLKILIAIYANALNKAEHCL